jgi:DNA polymerase V
MYALVDCNNFYASCQRVFRPELAGKPVVVLSLNDGCVISLSNEAKVLGLHVGSPAWQNTQLFTDHGVHVFSANFPLYGDMSNRVMTILGEFSPHVEIYSIDEAFLNLARLKETDFQPWCQRMRQRVLRCTGIPISVGLAPTKTLAKAANRIAKKFPDQTGGVHLIDSEERRLKALKWLKVEDVWGIGRRHAKRLKAMDVHTAHDFTQLSDGWVLKHMAIVGLRLKHELLGKPSQDLHAPETKKNIATTRSFEHLYTELEQLKERVSTFAIACGEKLRKQGSCAHAIMVMIDTNWMREDLPQYSRSIVIRLPFPTNSSIELSKFATQALAQIFQPGYHYKRAGVVVTDLCPEDRLQLNIFENRHPQHAALMKAMDRINQHWGQHTIKLASQDQQRMWIAKQEMLSPGYTSRLSDVIAVRA